MVKKLNYAGRVYDNREIESLKKAATEFWLTHGRYCDEFQEKLRLYIGTDHCAVVNSGSSANLLAFMALTSHKLEERRIQKGDQIITTAACFPTTVAPIIQYGAVPVFVDISIPSYNLDISSLDAALSTKTKAVVLAHTLGNPFNIEEVLNFCVEHDLWLIEDCADALGGSYALDGEIHKLGNFGDLSTFSFYPAHQITTGQGGAVATPDDLLYRIVTSLREWGRDCSCKSGQDNACGMRFAMQYGDMPAGYDHKYIYSEFGYNVAMTDMQGAIGIVQMDKLPYFKLCRKANWNKLRDSLKEFDDLFYIPEAEPYSDPCWFGFMLTIKDPERIDRRRFQIHLEKDGIQTRLLFAGNITRQPCFAHLVPGRDYKMIGLLPNTDIVTNQGIWMGVYPGLHPEDIEYMADSVKRFVKEHV